MTSFYNTIVNYTATSDGAMPLLFAIRDGIPYSFSALTLTIFFVLTAGQYFIIKNRSSRGKILTALLSSSIMMVIMSLMLAMAQLVTFITVLFYGFCAIVFFALYQMSDSW